MAGVNKVILVGNLGKDPEIWTFEDGTKKASFSLATTESYKDKMGNKVDQTEWHNIVLWRGLAGVAEQYLKKGSSIYVEGKIRSRSYQDKDGITKYVTEIFADNMTMLGGRAEGGQSNQSAPPPAHHDSPSQVDSPASSSEPDDLPF